MLLMLDAIQQLSTEVACGRQSISVHIVNVTAHYSAYVWSLCPDIVY